MIKKLIENGMIKKRKLIIMDKESGRKNKEKRHRTEAEDIRRFFRREDKH